jgi:hypothetical protein
MPPPPRGANEREGACLARAAPCWRARASRFKLAGACEGRVIGCDGCTVGVEGCAGRVVGWDGRVVGAEGFEGCVDGEDGRIGTEGFEGCVDGAGVHRPRSRLSQPLVV